MLTLPLMVASAWAVPVLQTPTVNRGRIMELRVTGANPTQLVYFTSSTTGPGAGPCVGATCADTLNPTIIGTGRANASGEAWLKLGVPLSTPAGQQVWYQAFPKQGARYLESNVVNTSVVQPAYVRCYDPGIDAAVVRIEPVTVSSFEGYPLYYYMPANPRGVIFYFHGGDEGPSEILNNEQTAQLFNQMGVNENFGIVATERTAQAPGTSWDWSTPANNNSDARRMDRLRTWLITNTGMDSNDPIVTTGFSDGAGFATSFANYANNSFGWNVDVSTPHNGAFGNTPTVPTVWHIAENDDSGSVNGIGALEQAMNQAGRAYLSLDTPERRVVASQFLREPAWELATGQLIVDDLEAHGLIDANGNRIIPDNQIQSEIDAWVASSNLTEATLGAARLRTLWATHRYSAYDNQAECDFIRDRFP